VVGRFIICTLHQISLGSSNKGRLRWMKHVAHIGYIKNAYKILVEKLEHEIPSERLAIGRSLKK
jgi:hypothetical protein